MMAYLIIAAIIVLVIFSAVQFALAFWAFAHGSRSIAAGVLAVAIISTMGLDLLIEALDRQHQRDRAQAIHRAS